MAVAFTEAIEDGGDRRMVELSQGIGFAVEVFDRAGAFFMIGKTVEDLFYCTAALSQALIGGNIHETHATTRKEAFNAVSSREKRSRFELSTLVARHG